MIQRKVRKIHASHIEYASAGNLERMLNHVLTNGEYIVGSHYIDGAWWIITEKLGLTGEP